MARPVPAAVRDVEAYLRAQEAKGLLRFITCGSVDDGKSTLIGRLLYESKLLFEDQIAQLQADSSRHGRDFDLSLLVDGLSAAAAACIQRRDGDALRRLPGRLLHPAAGRLLERLRPVVGAGHHRRRPLR